MHGSVLELGGAERRPRAHWGRSELCQRAVLARRGGLMAKLFDAHCHLQDGRIAQHTQAVLQAAEQAGVARMSVNSCHEGDWDRVRELCDQHPDRLTPNFGLHPWRVAPQSPQHPAAARA